MQLSSLFLVVDIYLLAVHEELVPRPLLNKRSYGLIRLFSSRILGALIIFFRLIILLGPGERVEGCSSKYSSDCKYYNSF